MVAATPDQWGMAGGSAGWLLAACRLWVVVVCGLFSFWFCGGVEFYVEISKSWRLKIIFRVSPRRSEARSIYQREGDGNR